MWGIKLVAVAPHDITRCQSCLNIGSESFGRQRVSMDKIQNVAFCCPRTRVHLGGAAAHRAGQHSGSGLVGQSRSIVFAATVHDEDFGNCRAAIFEQIPHKRPDALGFVQYRDDDGKQHFYKLKNWPKWLAEIYDQKTQGDLNGKIFKRKASNLKS